MNTTMPSLEPKLEFGMDDLFYGPGGRRIPLRPERAEEELSGRTQSILAALDAIHTGRRAGLAAPIDSVPAQWPQDSMRMHAKVVALVTAGMAWPILFDLPRPTGFGLLSGFFILAFTLVRGYRMVMEEQRKTDEVRAKYLAAREQTLWVTMCRNMVRKVVLPHDRVIETAGDVVACVPVLQRLLAKRDAQGLISFPQPNGAAMAKVA